MGSTEIKGAPKKVVILTNEGTEALLSHGCYSSWGRSIMDWRSLVLIISADEMKDAKVVGTESELNIEAIAKLQPDLIIGNKMSQEDKYDQLKAIAPTVMSETFVVIGKKTSNYMQKPLIKKKKAKK